MSVQQRGLRPSASVIRTHRREKGGRQQCQTWVKALKNSCVFCTIDCLLQARGSFQAAHVGADGHQQHGVPVSVGRQPLAGGPNGEKLFHEETRRLLLITQSVVQESVSLIENKSEIEVSAVCCCSPDVPAGLPRSSDRSHGGGRLNMEFPLRSSLWGSGGPRPHLRSHCAFPSLFGGLVFGGVSIYDREPGAKFGTRAHHMISLCCLATAYQRTKTYF